MSTNDSVDRSLTPIRTAIGDFIRYFMREMLPAVPWRAAALWGIALGGSFVIRELLDLLKPTTEYGLRSLASTSAGLAICFCAGFQGAWRSGGERHLHIWHGSRIALTAIVIGFLVAIVGNTSTVLVVSTFHELDLSHELAWALEIPLHVMLVVGGLVGMAGAAIAAGLARFRHVTVVQS